MLLITILDCLELLTGPKNIWYIQTISNTSSIQHWVPPTGLKYFFHHVPDLLQEPENRRERVRSDIERKSIPHYLIRWICFDFKVLYYWKLFVRYDCLNGCKLSDGAEVLLWVQQFLGKLIAKNSSIGFITYLCHGAPCWTQLYHFIGAKHLEI